MTGRIAQSMRGTADAQMVGNGRRERRLTLTPVTTRSCQSSSARVEAVDGEAEEEDGRWRDEGRAALSRAVVMAVEATRKPKPVHGAQHLAGVLPFTSKFWALGGDSESEEDEPEPASPVTPPPHVGSSSRTPWTWVSQLSRAEQILEAGKSSSPSSVDLHLPKSIVSTMVWKKLTEVPWQGPLPEPRVSPPRALGDALAMATYRTSASGGGSQSLRSAAYRSSVSLGNSQSTMWPASLSPARKELYSKKFEKPISQGNAVLSKSFETPFSHGADLSFPPLAVAAVPVSNMVAAQRAVAHFDRAHPAVAERVQIGPTKFFWPTKGLSALFARTGTKSCHRRAIKPPSQPAAYTRRSFVDVVCVGTVMAA